jgi:hypothetical protein
MATGPTRIAFSEICPSHGDVSPPGSPTRALGEIKQDDGDTLSESPYKTRKMQASESFDLIGQRISHQVEHSPLEVKTSKKRAIQKSKMFKELNEF